MNLPEILQANERPATMQVNITYACNLACRHCYLECGPRNNEVMSRETMEQILSAFKSGGYKTLDVTGGSPELHPDFEWFLREGAKIAEKVIVRTNLTLEEKPEYEHFLDVFAEVGVDVCVSLPYFDAENADNQRGRGVFKRAVANIRKLNERGYGREGGPELEVVYNVAGPFLPPPQELLADAYRVKLTEQQGIDFNEPSAFNNPTNVAVAYATTDAPPEVPLAADRHVVTWKAPVRPRPAVDLHANLVAEAPKTKSVWQRVPSWFVKLEATHRDEAGRVIYRLVQCEKSAGMQAVVTDGFLARGNGRWTVSFDLRARSENVFS